MAGKKGFAAVARLRERAQRAKPGALAFGGNAPHASALVRDAADALAVCVDAWLEALRDGLTGTSTLATTPARVLTPHPLAAPAPTDGVAHG